MQVQLLHGPAGQGEELADPQLVVLEQNGPAEDGPFRYEGSRAECDRAGRYGITVRIVPNHSTLVTPAELGRITWG